MSRKLLPSRIYLTGFTGCGKSTVAPVLAGKLGYEYVDLDLQVEEAAQQSITTIFEEGGDAAFRVLEAAALEQTLSRERLVVATGGGALLSQEALRLTRSAGTVIYLRLASKVLAERLVGVTNRPILRDIDGRMPSGNALRTRIEILLEERMPLYEQADLLVDVDNLSPSAIADIIAGSLWE